MDLQIEGRQTALRPEWRADIESRVADLHPNHEITHIRATLTKHDHRKPADSHSVLLVVQIPGHTITAGKHHETFEEAIRLTLTRWGSSWKESAKSVPRMRSMSTHRLSGGL